MASSSSSTSNTQSRYHVFISFRGGDVRDAFLSHLEYALGRKQLLTFTDDQLKRGQEISRSLLQVIEESTTSIIIFSKNYANSPWCLDELLHILRCRNKGQFVLPVFYRVDPTNVEEQSGSFGKAFKKVKMQFEKNIDKVKEWSSALKEAASISGLDWRNFRNEHMLTEKIAEYVNAEVRRGSSAISNGLLVGIDSRVEEVQKLLDIESTDKILFVGIWGIGGIGKTTITEVLYWRIFNKFDGCCFIRNIREKSEKHDLTYILSKIISTVLQDNGIQIETLDALPTSIVDRLEKKKVLIVLDDINERDHLKLVRNRDWFMQGSRVILTGRNKMLMNEADKIYDVKELQDEEASELFCLKAFKQKEPSDQDYRCLSTKMVAHAQGVPLALNILGSLMYNKKKEEWESKLRELEESHEEEIQKVLKSSYDNLDGKEKKIFLDIACFLKGEDEYWVKRILDDCGFFASHKINSLVDKSLITIMENKVEMHDLLQEMGRAIVLQSSERFGERSRLWISKEVTHVLTHNTGTSAIEGMLLDVDEIENIKLNPEAFLKIDKLRLLKVYAKDYGSKWDGDLQFLPNTLNYLYWQYYPWKSLPVNFSMEKLVRLDIRYSKLEELWSEEKRPHQLKSVDVCHSDKLIKLPNLSFATSLESITLDSCSGLVEILPCIEELRCLNCLHIESCTSLKSIPSLLCLMSLKIFKVLKCYVLEKILDIPKNVEEFELSYCTSLTSLPSTHCLDSLKKLDISSCVNLKKFPQIRGINLNYLSLADCGIKELPSWFGCLSSLVHLNLQDNEGLEPLASSIYELINLQYLNLNNCRLSEISSKIGNLSSLKELYLIGNDFKMIPESIKQISKLRILDVSKCERLKYVPEVSSNLHSISAAGCVSLEQTSLCEEQQIYFQEFHDVREQRQYKFDFWNCVMLNENVCNNILANMWQRIQDMATKLLKLFNENHHNSQGYHLSVILPGGTQNMKWFEYQNKSSASSITTQLSHDCSRSEENFAGLTFYVLIGHVEALKELRVSCKCHFKMNDCVSKSFTSLTKFNPPSNDGKYGLGCTMIIWYENILDRGINWHNVNEVCFEFLVSGVKNGLFDLKVKNCGFHVVYAQDEIRSTEPRERDREKEEAMPSNIITTEYNNEVISCSLGEEETNNK